MKKTSALFLTIFTSLLVIGQQDFYYSIQLQSPFPQALEKVYISYEVAGDKFKDSIRIVNMGQMGKMRVPQPVAAIISTNLAGVAPVPVMLANNKLLLTVTDKSLSISKSKLQDDFLFLTANDRIRPAYFPLYGELSAKNDTAGLNKLGIIFDSLKKDDVKKSFNYFRANKNSYLSLFSFNRYTTFFADYSVVENDFALLPEWAKSSPEGKSILSKIEGAKSAQVNTRARDFVQQTPSGETIALSNFKGKYVLLDFWASWCAPCRKEHPNLIEIYANYKDRNFEIVSVSLDADRSSWLAAIQKDMITWTQLSDLRGQQNDIAVKYGVQSIPTNFLISPDGIIIEKNLSGVQLKDKLKALLENPQQAQR